MFDVGFGELLVIGVVGLIVIGPKDLPDMFRTMGRFTAKARSMARDFQRAMDSAASEAGVKDIAKDLNTIASPRNMGLEAVKQAASKFEKWDPLKPAPKPVAARPATALVPDPAAPIVPSASIVVADTPVAAPMGPATQALADAVAAKRAALLGDAPAVADPATPLKSVTRRRGAKAETDGAATVAAPAAKKPAKTKVKVDLPPPPAAPVAVAKAPRKKAVRTKAPDA